LVFPGLKEQALFNGFGLRLMFVEHQSTSGTKIESLRRCTRAVMPYFGAIDFTGLIVK
jgi:hypothetical protein